MSPNRRREAGFTIVEMVVVMALGTVVFSALLSFLVSSLNLQTLTQNKLSQVDQAQVAIQRLVRELRQASAVTVNSTTSISYAQPISTGTQSVVFSCASGTCTRTAGGVSQTVISNVAAITIAATPNSTSPTYVTVNLSVSATKRSTVTLSDGAGLRNVTMGA